MAEVNMNTEDEEIIPGTPDCFKRVGNFLQKNSSLNLRCRIQSNGNSGPDGKLRSKSKQSVKRKKNGLLSPDVSNAKQKTAKQMTLQNFIIRQKRSQNNDPVVETGISSKQPVVQNLSHIFNIKSNVKCNNELVKPQEFNVTEKEISVDTKNYPSVVTMNSYIEIPESIDINKDISSEVGALKLTNICDSGERTKNTNSVQNGDFMYKDTKKCVFDKNSPRKAELLDDCQTLYMASVPKDNLLSATAEIKSARTEEDFNELPCDANNSFNWLSDLDLNDFENENLLTSDALLQKFSPSKTFHGSQNAERNDAFLTNSSDIKFRIAKINRHTRQNEIELLLENTSQDFHHYEKCILRGFWIDSLLNEGDIVRVLAPFVNNCAVIDNNSGFLVINPDFLVSSTAIVSTLFCMRKAALSQKFRYWDSQNSIMMIGSFVHQLFQQAVNDAAYSEQEIEIILTKIIQRIDNLITMCCMGISELDVKQELSAFVSSISKWIMKHCTFKEHLSTDNIQVTEIRDIEDNVWCTQYGIKGKIDLTVQVTLRNEKVDKLMPLELKTGRPSYAAEHKGQVNLYTLMMEDRTKKTSDGLLLYLKDGPDMKLIPASHDTRRGLIQLRNELAHYIYKWNNFKDKKEAARDISSGNCYLPEPIDSRKLCQKCPYLLPCTIYQRAYENNKVQGNTHAMSKLVPDTTSHLSESHLEYFRHWSQLLFLESSSFSDVKCFWNEDATSREKKGLCFSYMILQPDTLTQQAREGGVYIHTFFRAPHSTVKTKLSEVGLLAGDFVAISNQENSLEVALVTGFITKVENNTVEVSIERDIQQLTRYEGYLFRLDKQIPTSAGANVYNNLMKLMVLDEGPTRLRDLIIDKKPAEFLATMSKSIINLARPFLKFLNKPQRKAVFKVLMAKDYMLLKGMPGTGKTSTIVALVRLLSEMGLSVLLTSHTHSAVDNILLKLVQHNVDFLRIGHLAKIHVDIQPFSFEILTKPMTSVNELSTFIKSKMIVASTCLGVNHAIFKTRKFDVCVVDEASQIVQTSCLGPLYLAKKFVLVGDPKQLPPLVTNDQAKLRGMQESLFSRLKTSSNCMELFLQYRMNREIMRLCNELTYDGVLQCGSEEIATAVLHLDYSKCSLLSLPKYKWLALALDNDLQNAVVFLNTDQMPAFESRDKLGRIKNDIEIQIVSLLVNCMIKCGLSVHDIGIIAPYRCQIEFIKNTLEAFDFGGIEVNTVDQYQGKDKEVIIISCVKSTCDSSSDSGGEAIVGDERRLNVALSRAKKKLIILGSKKTLTVYKCFEDLFTCLRSEQTLDLPQDAQIYVSQDCL